ncbi:acyltransferase family protein [Chryseobacterium sp. CT-SW4]|uniref:acyltransferase family protein n=1 Tax=Chryseobacterium sp. SW-1 TaxID=3157343 RepID=UPI003B028517
MADKVNNSRIETLDWLRGLMAISIMFYHLTMWKFKTLDSSDFLGRLGIYGVSIFFILSGLSMAIVYHKNITSINKLLAFFLRRVFRIIPLLFIVTTFTVFLNPHLFDIKKYILNITSLFGFFDYGGYIATGAWSIGNEMVYYIFTPFIFFAYNYSKLLGNIIFFIVTCIGLYFAFNILDSNILLKHQWKIYIHPFNNFFLYYSGIAMFYNLKDSHIKPYYNNLLLIVCILLFIFYPVVGDSIKIITDFNRIIFVLLSFLIVFSFYKLTITLPTSIANLLETFGIATYGVYMFHPVIYNYLYKFAPKIIIQNYYIVFVLVVVSTVFIAIVSYYKFEFPLSNYGKKLINKYLK